MSRHALLESLENRTLFNITAASFIGPLKTSSKYVYRVYTGTTLDATQNEEVLGASSFEGNPCTRIKSTFSDGSIPATSELDQYLTLNGSGLQIFGVVRAGGVSPNTETITTTYLPENIELPPSMEAGRTYKFVYTSTTVSVTNPGAHKSTSTLAITTHVKLESNSASPLAEGGTTYHVYKLELKTTTTSGTMLVEYWFDPTVGLVKEVSDSGGSIVISSYKP